MQVCQGFRCSKPLQNTEKLFEVRSCRARSLFTCLPLTLIYYFREFRLMSDFYYVASTRDRHIIVGH